MAKPITFAICGCGCRGLEVYASFQKRSPEKMKIVAGADPRSERLELLQSRYDVPSEMCFTSDKELLSQPRLADVMIISTQDRQHMAEALAALDKGYHILLEKPISPDLGECLALQKKAQETGRIVLVCHVLRYTKFYGALKELLQNGSIGQIETIDAFEHVAYWHFAHSYVRGHWRRSEETSPIIMAKCCHDMDLLRWLADASCVSIQSFGSLSYFKPERAPEGAALRCLDGCGVKESCPYDAEKIYFTNKYSGIRNTGPCWPCNAVTPEPPTEENLYEALRTGPYGRCVFHCDNDVADHQTVNMEFANGVTAAFTMSAFTEACHRTIKVTGTLGEIEGDLDQNKLYLRRFGEPEKIIELAGTKDEFAGHGGGDTRMIEQLCDMVANGGQGGLTSLDASIESHVMALAAEESRINGGKTIRLSDFTAKA